MGAEGSSSTSTSGEYKTKYDQQYDGQLPSGRDDYGNPTYTRYEQSYAGELPTGRDDYGSPTYDD
jgi:hypothetical protein